MEVLVPPKEGSCAIREEKNVLRGEMKEGEKFLEEKVMIISNLFLIY